MVYFVYVKQIVKILVKAISCAKGLNEQLVKEVIFTFDSYHLGIHKYFSFRTLLNLMCYVMTYVFCAMC